MTTPRTPAPLVPLEEMARHLMQVADAYAASAALLVSLADQPLALDTLAMGISSAAKAGATGSSVLASLLEHLEVALVSSK